MKKIGDQIKSIKGISFGFIVKQGRSKNTIIRLLKLGDLYRVQYGSCVYELMQFKDADSEYNRMLQM